MSPGALIRIESQMGCSSGLQVPGQVSRLTARIGFNSLLLALIALAIGGIVIVVGGSLGSPTVGGDLLALVAQFLAEVGDVHVDGAGLYLRPRLYTPHLGEQAAPVHRAVEGYEPRLRAILEVLRDCRHPVTIVTKSAGVLRDLDILGQYHGVDYRRMVG